MPDVGITRTVRVRISLSEITVSFEFDGGLGTIKFARSFIKTQPFYYGLKELNQFMEFPVPSMT